jgi:hypothetical protein
MGKRRKLTAAKFINVDRRVGPTEARQRMAERDQRQAADTRTPAQVLLGEPPPGRSALVKGQEGSQPRPKSTGTRVDLWRR